MMRISAARYNRESVEIVWENYCVKTNFSGNKIYITRTFMRWAGCAHCTPIFAMGKIFNLCFLLVFLWETSIDGFILNGKNGDQSFNTNVDMSCGRIRGQWNSEDQAYSFLGIPYAEPPVRSLRWKPPVPLSKRSCWTGTLIADSPGSTCFQPDFTDPSKTLGQEDCLYLNVWTPSLNAHAALPVMVWIHGGYLLTGNGNQEDIGYSPSTKLARDLNMVFVSMNYRLNAFGFMALDILARTSPTGTSGNYGFMDQIEALRWVQANIEQFGGDKNQVTIFGQSSGGTSVYALLASPLTENLFHKAWIQSGSPVMNKSAADAFKDNEIFLQKANCFNLTCLYDLTPLEVLASVPWDVYPYWLMNDLMFLPTAGRFDGALAIIDGYVLKESPFEAWVHGRGRDVPTMIGSTAQEADLQPQIDKNSALTDEEEYVVTVRRYLDTFGDVIVDTALKLYPSNVVSPEYQINTMIADVRVNCATDFMTLIASEAFSSPVYRYIASFETSNSSSPFGIDFSSKFSFHGVDSYAFFGTFDEIMSQSSQKEDQFQSKFRSEIMSFVKTGHPATREWKPYPESTALVSEVTHVTNGYHTAQCMFWLKNGFFSYSWIN